MEHLFTVNGKVKFDFSADQSYLNDSMKLYMQNNRDRIFRIEKVGKKSVKLLGVYFWITKNLLEVVTIFVPEIKTKLGEIEEQVIIVGINPFELDS